MFATSNDEEPQPKTCWSTKTPFQMGLILVLCVAIPFLIMLIIAYIFSLIVGNQSGSCSTLCDTLYYWKTQGRGSGPTDYPNYGEGSPILLGETDLDKPQKKPKTAKSSNKTIHLSKDIAPDSSSTTSSTTTQTGDDDKEDDTDDTTEWKDDDADGYHLGRAALLPTAALLENMYNDDKNQILKCLAVAVSNKWVLCTENCAKDKDLFIRIGSPYWSKEGIFRQVKNIVYSKDTRMETLALIEFDKGRWIKRLIIEPLDNDIKGYMVFWKNKLDLPLHQRRKFETLNTVDFEIYPNINCSKFCKHNYYGFAASKNSLCENNSNALIFNEFHAFIGFHVETLCPKHYNYSIVMYINVYQYKSWINNVVNKN